MKRNSICAINSFIGALLGLAIATSAANAATVTDQFEFYDNRTLVASGSFSYSSSNYSGLLTFSDLLTFTISGQGQTYGISDVLGPLNSYNYFGFDTTSQTFVPAAVGGSSGSADAILSAVDETFSSGFFFDPLPGQPDPLSNKGNDGLYSFYLNCTYCTATGVHPSYTALTVSAVTGVPSVPAVPEGSTWVMTILGFAGVGFAAYRRKSRLAFKIFDRAGSAA